VTESRRQCGVHGKEEHHSGPLPAHRPQQERRPRGHAVGSVGPAAGSMDGREARSKAELNSGDSRREA